MKPRSVAARHAALFNTLSPVVFVIAFPADAQAKTLEIIGFEKSDLETATQGQ